MCASYELMLLPGFFIIIRYWHIINYYSNVYCNNIKCSNTSSLDCYSVCISYANNIYIVDFLFSYYVAAWDCDDD